MECLDWNEEENAQDWTARLQSQQALFVNTYVPHNNDVKNGLNNEQLLLTIFYS